MKTLIVQIFIIAMISTVLGIFFSDLILVNILLPASGFMVVFLSMQIKENLREECKEISSDGIFGARMSGIIINAILLPWALGVFDKLICNILLGIAAIICLVRGWKETLNFFEKNEWEKEYWYVYLGVLFALSNIYSILSYFDIAPCGICSLPIRGGIMCLIFLISKLTLPPNTKFALFVTKNYEKRDN